MTSIPRIKLGIIGLGEVAQIIHFPVLESLSERYEITAICDISPKLLEVIGNRYHVPNRYVDAAEMASLPELDAVLICNSDEYHADCVIAAIKNRKHVLVENRCA